MRAYTIRRLIAIIPTLFLASLIVFFVIRIIPGDIIDQMIINSDAGDMDMTRQSLEKALGLDAPLYVQYYDWLKMIILEGDLGYSLWDEMAVTDEVMERLPVSLELAIIAFIISLIVALPVGVIAAIRQDTWTDYIGRTFSILGLSIPNFWLATIVVVVSSKYWGWSPPVEIVSIFEDPSENIQLFIVPGVIMGIVFSAVIMRMTRAMMLEVLRQDYIRTAWAKGLKEKVIIVRHALKNALIPVITIIGLQIPYLIGGLVIMENIFSLPGLGTLILQSILTRDYPMVTGVMLIMGLFTLLINLIVDLSYGFFDPKVKYD